MIPRRSLIAQLAAAVAVVSAPAIAQQAQTDNLEISNGFVRATFPLARAGIAYMTITSRGAADRLLGYTTPACNRPEIHVHVAQDGVMMMRQVEAVAVPAGGVAVLEPGGLHLMMIDLNSQLIEGETVEFTLIFEHAGEIQVSFPILDAAATGPVGD